jgi:prepilin-type processing-associated H-X9-DG protein
MMRRKHRAAVAWLLVIVMAMSPSMVYAQQPAAAVGKPAGGGLKLDLGYVTPETVAAVVVHPRRVLTSPEMEMLPTEVLSAAGKKELGIDPVEIEQILLIAEPPQAGPPQAGIVVRLASPLGAGEILPQLLGGTREAELQGKTYRQGAGPMGFSVFRAEERTLIVAHDGLLRKMVANHAQPQEGNMSRLLGRMKDPPDLLAFLLVEPLRPLLAGPMAEATVPPPLADIKKIPDLVSSIGAKVNLTGDMAMSLAVRAQDEAAAEQLEEIIDRLLALAKQAVLAQIGAQAASSDPVEQAAAKYAQRMSERLIPMFRPERKGSTLTLATTGQAKFQVATIGVLVALLLPAVQAARSAARRTQAANNLKQIGLAMHNHHDVFKAFPARAICDKDGKPLLSWRVRLLPFLEQDNLYKQFHLDEPWDSEHNQELIALMPAVFRNPSSVAPPGKANYLGVSGKGLMFDGVQGRKFSELTDGTSNTIMVVEADDDRAVTWTQPDDWEFDAKRPLAGLGKSQPGGFQVLFADGSVRFMSQTINPDVFRKLLTVGGGEAVPNF